MVTSPITSYRPLQQVVRTSRLNKLLFTGNEAIDSLFKGFSNGELVVFYSPIGTKIEAILQSITRSLNEDDRRTPLLFVSLKQTAITIVTEIAESYSEITDVNFEDWPVYINDPAILKVDEMITIVQQAQTQNNLSLILVDGVEMLEVPNGASNKQWESDCIRYSTLKKIARQLNIPVLVTARATGNPYTMDASYFYAANKFADRIVMAFQPIVENVKQNLHGQPYTLNDYEIILYNSPTGDVRKTICLKSGILQLGLAAPIVVKIEGKPVSRPNLHLREKAKPARRGSGNQWLDRLEGPSATV